MSNFSKFASMKFGVIIFPGSNCDEDIFFVLHHILQQKVVRIWHKDTDLQNSDFVIVPGGFSYGDYLRSGAIARFSPIMESVISHAQRGGYVLGICNGFQILTEAHLLPGVLLPNQNRKFICRNVFLKFASDSVMSSDAVYQIPIAHADGRYYAEPDTIRHLNENGQVIFRYCNENGEATEASNPNGSLDNIAGITNERRNVFGLMPHPERAADEALGNTDGRQLLETLLATVQHSSYLHS